MKIACVGCGQEITLDHVVFQNYEGPVKCFRCGTMMKMKTTQGIVDQVFLLLEGPEIHRGKSASMAESRSIEQRDAP
jgi:uncharacterized Zn finger protein